MNLIDAILQHANVLQSTPAIKQKLAKLMKQQDVILIALCGESASGKTTLLNALKDKVPQMSVISADNYFCEISDRISEVGSFTKLVESGYETESSQNFQMDLLSSDLKALRSGRTIDTPYYEMRDGSSKAKAIHCRPSKIVFVESICTLYPEVRDLFDLKIYLSIDKAVQWKRYQERAITRNQDPLQMKKQFEIVSKAASKYIIPNKEFADLVIEGKVCEAEQKAAVRFVACHKDYPININQQHEREE